MNQTEHSSAKPAVIITGASTGIGFHSAEYLVSKGFQVFGSVRKTSDEGVLRDAGIQPFLLDVSQPDSVKDAAKFLDEQLEGKELAGLVNNAGISLPGPAEVLNLDEYRDVFEVNFFGTVAMTKAMLPLLKQSKGRIVNISSIAVKLLTPFNSPYVASKSALEAFSDCLRRELFPYGIEVVVIQPGNIKTPMWKKSSQRDVSRLKGTIYEPLAGRSRDQSGQHRGMDPHRTSDAIFDALTTPRPALRIPVVAKPWRQFILRLIPERTVIKRIWERISTSAAG